MKANQFFEKILDKWPVKVCCLIVAICLYLFHQASLTDKRSFVIPLTLIEEGGVMHTGDYTSNVTVVVRANMEELSSVHSNQLHAFVNLNGIAKTGEYNLPVKVKVADEIMAFDPFEIKVKPEYIKIKVENKDFKYIPLEPTIVGEPAHGYEITEVQVDPLFVEVNGPQTIIENTQKLFLEKVDVTNLTANQNFSVQYKSLNKLISIKESGPFNVSVVIEPQEMERTLDNVNVSVVGLSERFYLKDDVMPVSVTLEGNVVDLEKYNPAKRLVTLELQRILEPGEYDLPLTFNVPSYLYFIDSSEKTVHITVLNKEEETQESNETEGITE